MDQTLLTRLSLIVGIAVGVQILLGVAFSGFMAWLNQKTRADMGKTLADMAKMRDDIMDRLDKKLDEYVRLQRFKDYQEAHAKEHVDIQSEITRLRDWKHETAEPLIRKHDVQLGELDERR